MKLVLSSNGRSVYVFGEDDAGKTSLLQAIERCIFAGLAYLLAEEYKLEDALVNAFHAGKAASLKLSFKDEKERTAKLSRTGKMGKTTIEDKTEETADRYAVQDAANLLNPLFIDEGLLDKLWEPVL